MQHSDLAKHHQGVLKGISKTQVVMVEECQSHGLASGKVEG